MHSLKLMKAIVPVQKSDSSVKHCLKKCKQTWFQMRIRLRGAENLKRWEEGEGGRREVGLQKHGIGGHRLVCKEVVEVGSNYKNSYFWWFRSDSTGSNRLCVWHKSTELGDRRSPRFPTPVMESFFADLLPALKCIYFLENYIMWETGDLILFILQFVVF